LPALPQGRPIPGEAGGRARIQETLQAVRLDLGHGSKVVEGRLALVERDPPLERADLVPDERPGERQGVFALDTEPWMQDPLGPAAVIVQAQEPLAVL